jgi:hypothetical protein
MHKEVGQDLVQYPVEVARYPPDQPAVVYIGIINDGNPYLFPGYYFQVKVKIGGFQGLQVDDSSHSPGRVALDGKVVKYQDVIE